MVVLPLLTGSVSPPDSPPKIIQEHLSYDLQHADPSAVLAGLVSVAIDIFKQIFEVAKMEIEFLVIPQISVDSAEPTDNKVIQLIF